LGHQCERPAFGVREERHPLFRAVRVPMDHVRSAFELDTARDELRVLRIDIGDSKIENRLCGARAALRAQVQARAAAVEERQVAERVEMTQTERVAIPRLSLLDIPHGPRNLPDRPELALLRLHRRLLELSAAGESAVPRSAAPLAQRPTIDEP